LEGLVEGIVDRARDAHVALDVKRAQRGERANSNVPLPALDDKGKITRCHTS